MRKLWLSLIGGVALGACASAPVPTEQLVESQANVKAADELGAQRHPKAAYYLQLANEGIGKANKQIANGENEEAHYTLMRAKADSELALAMAKEAHARGDADSAQQRLQDLRGDAKGNNQ